MAELYVAGGRQKSGVGPDVEEWHHYAAGMVLSVDTDTGAMRELAEWVSPPEACPDDAPSIVFKTASLKGSRYYVPTQTEILIYDVPSFRKVGYISLPCFNDVHHVVEGPNGSLYAANTGLDQVLELTPDGQVVREWSSIGEDTWSRFSRDVDYRKVATTKPHKSHPNHVWFLDGDLWVTRCDQKDVFCLTRELPPVPIADRWIHDGVVRGDSVYFTAVNGHVVIMDAKTRTVKRDYDLNAIVGEDSSMGWCRGIEVLEDGKVVVGFSRIRPTKWKKNIEWVKAKVGVQKAWPTRLAMFDLENEELVWEHNLEPAGMNVVFSVHEAV